MASSIQLTEVSIIIHLKHISLMVLLFVILINTASAILPPAGSFSSDYTGGISPLLVNFTDTSTNTPAAWAWYYTKYAPGNNKAVLFSSIQNPRFVPFYTGNWSIQLRASNAAGGTNTTAFSYWVNVSNAPSLVSPVPAFSAGATAGSAPLTVQFTDSSFDNILGWNWNFGDGSTSTASNPVHTYTTPGIYTVSLEVVNVTGYKTTTKPGFITVGNSPVAAFTGTPLTGTAPLDVKFTDSSTGPSITNRRWDFGDGNISSYAGATNPSHRYSSAGTYSVTLTVTNAGGSNSQLRSNYISVGSPPPAAPVAAFTGTPLTGTAPLDVKFTDSSTGTSITNRRWDFGDGNISTYTASTNPSHRYTSTGTYTINLTVTNAGGSNSQLRSGYISVNAPPSAPVASFTGTPLTGTAPLGVMFTDSSTGDSITNRRWDFGDGNASNFVAATNPSHWYSSAGTYSVNLTVTNAGGSNSHLRTNYVTVSQTVLPASSRIGVTNGQQWYLDATGNGVWDTGADRAYTFGAVGWTSVLGDWNGDGKSETGIYKDGTWYLDYNGNGIWDAGIDKADIFGTLGWTPVVGNWNGDATGDKIGIFRDGSWYLDNDGSGTWNTGDRADTFGGSGWTPVIGNWNGNTTGTKTGIYKDGTWYLDYNGNGIWDAGIDKADIFGKFGWTPVVGNWN
jgi:PKD repeat protein